MTLREIVHAHIPTLTMSSTVRDAVDKMDIYQFPSLVILDDNGYPSCVVTEGDICRAVARRDSVVSISKDPAHVYGSREPTVINADTEIGSAFHIMLGSGLTILPVIDEEKFMGIVLRVDLMQAMFLDADNISP
jgi:CBS domain-containing protein